MGKPLQSLLLLKVPNWEICRFSAHYAPIARLFDHGLRRDACIERTRKRFAKRVKKGSERRPSRGSYFEDLLRGLSTEECETLEQRVLCTGEA